MNNKSTLTITSLFTDKAGESHFKDITIESTLVEFAPPAPSVYVTTPTETKRHLFLTLPGEWYGDAHPAPNRQIMTVLNGELEVAVSDGTKRVFKAGDIALVEDTTGKGHSTRNKGKASLTLSVTQL